VYEASVNYTLAFFDEMWYSVTWNSESYCRSHVGRETDTVNDIVEYRHWDSHEFLQPRNLIDAPRGSFRIRIIP
jgi:hypothetical protein